MALREDIVNEKVALDTIVKRDALGKHINEAILRPILDNVEMASRRILDDLGFMIVSEIQHRLASAPSGNTYEVWQYDEGGSPKYSFIGYYTASAKGGPPMSGGQTDSGLPTGSLYESFWYDVDPSGVLKITIDSPMGSERNYWYKGGKVFVGFPKHSNNALPVAEYFKILDRWSRPNFLRIIVDRKKKYWYRYMDRKFKEAVKAATRRWTVTRALKFNIYWESK